MAAFGKVVPTAVMKGTHISTAIAATSLRLCSGSVDHNVVADSVVLSTTEHPQECAPTLLFRSWAFACIRHLMYRIKRQHKALSPEVIRNVLIHVQHSVFKHKRKEKRCHAFSNPSRSKKNLCCDGKATTLPTVLIDITLKYLGICSA